MRGGKYLKVTQQAVFGDKYRSWININELHLLTEDYLEFADKDKSEFMTKEGNLRYEL